MEGETISIKKQILTVSLIVMFFILISAASANENITDDALQESEEPVLAEDIPTTIKSNDTAVVKGNDFKVELKTNAENPLTDKTVTFTFNNQTSTQKTDSDGVARLKITLDPGLYNVTYTFKESGYTLSTNTTELLVISTPVSTIKASDYVAYEGLKNTYTVKLLAGDTPLPDRNVTFTINGESITVKTNSKGKASIDLDLKKGTYDITYVYNGEENINPCNGTSTVKVKKGAGVTITFLNKIFRNKKTSKLKVKLTDPRGDPVAGKKIKIKLKKKTYTVKTNKDGIAAIKIRLKNGSYKVKVVSDKTGTFKKAAKTTTIKVKPKQARNNGLWLFGRDMKSVNFKTLQKYGVKHIILNFKSLELYGKSYVEKWIKTARGYGIKTHLWYQVFYNTKTGWKYPVKNGKINYNLINSKVKEAKKYAKVKGVAGVHFDYVRFPGNANNYKGAVKAVNYFIKKASKAVHKVNKKLIASAAVMPEPSSMKNSYAQDIPTMSKYLDAIMPMVYKGNYHASSNWIKQVTQTFVKQSKKAQIWTGLQSYKSDAKLDKLSAKELMADADAAALGGAKGVILFRYGLINYINFNEV